MSGAPNESQEKVWSPTIVVNLLRNSSRRSQQLFRVSMLTSSPSKLSSLKLSQASPIKGTLAWVKWQRTELRSSRRWESTSKIGLSPQLTLSGVSAPSSSGSSSRRTLMLKTPGLLGLRSTMTLRLCSLRATRLKRLSTSSTSTWLKSLPTLIAANPKSCSRLNVWSSIWVDTRRLTQAVRIVTLPSEPSLCSFFETTSSSLVCFQKRSVFPPRSSSFSCTRRSSMKNSWTSSLRLLPERPYILLTQSKYIITHK